jgi:DNA mismatch repair ATPase MutS
MSEIVDRVTPGSLVLCNESFSAANEREGSQIARQVISALTDAGVKVVFVTHHYDFAHRRHAEARLSDLFLRAEPALDGARTHRLHEDAPNPTSHAEDSLRKILG